LSDALCVHLSGDSSWGFCTQKCTGFGTCPALPVGTYPECILKQNGVSYCGFLCGGGYDCPSGLDCSAGEVCKP
jgi:hypothetical protein